MSRTKTRLPSLNTALVAALAIGLSGPALAQKTFTIAPHSDLRVLDPLQAAAAITTMHATNIYDSLFAWDPTLSPKPQMVESYKVSDDKLTYTFTLRPGQKFADSSSQCIILGNP
ncbi:MAG: hypothetical protein FJX54_24140 [Alphaproteobacteria bacterium]|nr:hypothetical protein [Alphaproteobacteria bacterium]